MLNFPQSSTLNDFNEIITKCPKSLFHHARVARMLEHTVELYLSAR